jgi:hypothetical protein
MRIVTCKTRLKIIIQYNSNKLAQPKMEAGVACTVNVQILSIISRFNTLGAFYIQPNTRKEAKEIQGKNTEKSVGKKSFLYQSCTF